ncbi:MAG: ABC transporter [Ruminococcaceae bacterium]|mgnify:FL=1|nr:ABC transporter [Oscillospiraceae bacterium]
MSAVFKREFKAYFTSPIGWIYLAVFFFFAGFYYYAGTVVSATATITPVFNAMQTIVMFLIPILTMRLFSEDKKQKTDQLLLTAPVGLTGAIFGKLLAAYAVYCIGFSVTLIYAFVTESFGAIEWSVFFSNFVGILLLGLALISIGAFISSLTENQVIAAIGGFGVMIGLTLVDVLASVVPWEWLSTLIKKISFNTRFSDFSQGILNFADIIFFLSVFAVFVFLTVRVFEKKRWS